MGSANSRRMKRSCTSPTRDPDKYWMEFEVKADGTLANGRKFADVTSTNPARVCRMG